MTYGRAGTFAAAPGARDALVAALLRAADALRDARGCLHYLVSTAEDDPDAVHVFEAWTDADAHAASLSLPAVQALVTESRPLVAGVTGSVLDVRGGLGLRAEPPGGPLRRGTGDEDHRALNRAYWDDRAPAHAASPEYGVDRFVADPTHLSDVVRFDLPRLGDLSGLRAVHLQCHIGTDTVSLARLGARVSGLDASPVSVREARSLVARTGADVDVVEGDAYDAVELLGAAASDLVYTGIGALNWLPDVRRWAQVVAGLLRPGGRLFLREGHPVLRALDDERGDGLLVLAHPYRETRAPLVWEDDTTYVQVAAPLATLTGVEWNHGLGEIVQALLDAGMELTGLVEHDSVPWEALPGLMEQVGGGEWRLRDDPDRLPHSYTLQAVRRG